MEELIARLANLVEEKERKDFLIFGSSSIILNGVDLGREVQDLDVFVSEKTYIDLKGRFVEKTKPTSHGIASFYEPGENIEIWGWWPAIHFDDAIQKAEIKKNSAQFPVAHLDEIVVWKTFQGREKDLKDLEKIKKYRAK